ncbi:MAG: CBS domain-containing protein [Nitrospirae bacterium]|nr:CBS domain-containing protein [Nitrospirota bacterium]
MKVNDLMNSKGKAVVSIDVGDSVEDAIRLMHTSKISAVIVKEQDKIAGIFTERDVVRAYIGKMDRKFREIPLRETMTTDIIVAELKDDLSDIMSVMVEKNIRHLPVVDESDRGKLIGMLSIRDIIQIQVKKITSELHYLRDYITGG